MSTIKSYGCFFLSFFSFQNTFLQETVRRECEERWTDGGFKSSQRTTLELRKLSTAATVTVLPQPGQPNLPAAAGSGQGERRLARLNSEKVIKSLACLECRSPPLLQPFPQPNRVSSLGLPTVPSHILPGSTIFSQWDQAETGCYSEEETESAVMEPVRGQLHTESLSFLEPRAPL